MRVMDSFARLDEGCGNPQKLSIGGLPKLLEKDLQGSLKKLTLRRIG
jgi:hypothetical protein